MREIILIAHNIRSTHNVGSLLRTADGFGISKVILSGYTPHPRVKNDQRLPHIIEKLEKSIHKTALGAELLVPYEYFETPPISDLKNDGFYIIGLEQNDLSTPIDQHSSPHKVALLLGEEIDGISSELVRQCDELIEIPMYGKKESFNVSVAAGIALYQLRVK